MDLSKFDEKHVRVSDIYGGIHTGVADYYDACFCQHEYGEDEDAVIIEGFLIYESQIASIGEIEVHGCVELRTERLILRRFRPEDADDLYRYLGAAPGVGGYPGRNPWATPETARETVRGLIGSYDSGHTYSWVMDVDDVIVGTIGTDNCKDGRIGVEFNIVKGWEGRGLATEALKKVLEYLTENEGIPCVTAQCAAENAGFRRVLEKAGMKLIRAGEDGPAAGDGGSEKLTYEYRKQAS